MHPVNGPRAAQLWQATNHTKTHHQNADEHSHGQAPIISHLDQYSSSRQPGLCCRKIARLSTQQLEIWVDQSQAQYVYRLWPRPQLTHGGKMQLTFDQKGGLSVACGGINMVVWRCALFALACGRASAAPSASSAYATADIDTAEDFPRWTAPAPDPSKPLGGYTRFNNSFTSEIYHGVKTWGTCELSQIHALSARSALRQRARALVRPS